MKRFHAIGLMVISALLVSSTGSAGGDAPKVRLRVVLRDGSVIVGTTDLEEFPIEHPALGSVKVNLRKLRGFGVDEETGRVEFWLLPDSGVQGKLGLETIPMTTLLGKVKVPVKYVRVTQVFDPESLKRGLVAHYTFEGDARDKSGNGNDGRIHGATPAADRFGKENGALRFDGKSAYVDIGAGKSLRMRKGFAIAAWVKFDRTPLESGVFGSASPRAKDGCRLSLGTSGFQLARSKDDAASIVLEEPLPFDRWHYVAASWNGHEAALFVNGEYVGEVEFEGRLPDGTANWIGKSRESLGYMKGVIDDVRIYNRGLTEMEMEELYKAGRPKGQGEEEEEDD